MFSFFRRSISDYFPQPNEEAIGGRPFTVDPMISHKRDTIHASPQMDFLYTQDFFDEIDRRTIMVNGEEVAVVTKADFDIVGASLGDIMRRKNVRDRRGFVQRNPE